MEKQATTLVTAFHKNNPLQLITNVYEEKNVQR